MYLEQAPVESSLVVANLTNRVVKVELRGLATSLHNPFQKLAAKQQAGWMVLIKCRIEVCEGCDVHHQRSPCWPPSPPSEQA
jgi:hypothetical protein